jgi:drug/metabolite transporter (DMT)-like permease
MHVRPTRLLPYFALAFGILALGLSALFVRWANVPGAVSGFYRVAIAAGLMALPALAAQRRANAPPPSRRSFLFAVLAGLFFTGDLATWNTALFLTNATNATLFGNTAPLWVGLGALLIFKEKLGRVFWLGLGLALAGAAVILGADFVRHPTLGFGDLLAISTGFFYGGFFLATQRAREGLSSLTSWWISALTSTLGLLVVSLALGQPLTGYPLASYLYLIALAVITQVGGYLAINYALGHLPASLVSPTLLGQPVVTALLAIPLLGEPLTLAQVADGVLVLAGIALVHRRRSAAAMPRADNPARDETISRPATGA